MSITTLNVDPRAPTPGSIKILHKVTGQSTSLHVPTGRFWWFLEVSADNAIIPQIKGPVYREYQHKNPF